MSRLTKEFLESIGASMDDQTFTAFSEHFDETLIRRVEESVSKSLSAEQLQQLRTVRDSGEGSTWEWLQENVPNLNEIIRAEVDSMLSEVVRNSDQI